MNDNMMTYKKTLALFIILFLICGNLFAYDFEVNGITYKTSSNTTVIVTGKTNSYTGAIVIPETVSYQGNTYSVTRIAEAAFSGSEDITSIAIPPTITFIDEEAFYLCVNLNTVYISSIESWCNIEFDWSDSNPLRYAKHLYIDGNEVNDIVIPEEITAINEYAFDSFVGIKSISLPKTLEWICKFAFRNCENLELVISNCTKLPYMDSDYNSPFAGISPKAKLVVPKGTIKTYIDASRWGSFFQEIVEEGNDTNTIISFADKKVKTICIANWDINGDGELSKNEAAVVTDLGKVFRESSIEIFPEFKYFTGITGVGAESFEQCKQLYFINLPPNIKTFFKQAFKECGFTYFSIPDGVENIGYQAFSGCPLKTIIIPASVKSISSDYPFPHSVSTIIIDVNNEIYECRNNGCIVHKETKTIIFGTNTAKIPSDVLHIGAKAFQGAYELTNIDLPSSVLTIGKEAFSYCSKLESVKIPVGLMTIDESAFSNCASLSEIQLPNTLISIGTLAFENCSKIESVTIPQNVSAWGGSTFMGCTDLTSVNVKCKIPVPYQSFANCEQLKSLVLAQGISSIGNNAFIGCTSLVSINLPRTIKSIGSAAYSNCSSLESIVIPDSITAIGLGAFESCTSLTRVESKIKQPFEINGVFTNLPYNSELYVPYGTKALYNSTNGWNVFGEIIEAEPQQFDLNIASVGNGSAMFNGKTIRNQSISIKITEGGSATIVLYPDDGHRISSVKVNGEDVIGLVVNNQLTIENISADMTIEVSFEAIPVTTYTLTIKSSGYGTVTYEGTEIRNKTSMFTIAERTTVVVAIAPDEGYRLKSVKHDDEDVTSSVKNSLYSFIMEANVVLEAMFEEDITEFAIDNMNYNIVSYSDRTARLVSGNIGTTLTVPATCTALNTTWTIIGVETDALANCTDLAAIIWNPEVQFNGNVKNPNLLLYVKDKKYAPTTVRNVVVDNVAEEITLSDAESGNPFYCPKAFTAQRITYEHNYSMTSGYQTCQGWETLALPFNVTTIQRQNGTEIVPRETWVQGSNKLPFWLYTLTELGWRSETTIAANTPYIISMPNNENYNSKYNISGVIQFIGTNVEVKASDNMPIEKNGNKILAPNYQYLPASESMYALNVNNQWCTNTTTEAEGSVFIKNLRPVHPFEAYLTVNGSEAARHIIPIFEEGESTGIINLPLRDDINVDTWFTLDGRKLFSKPTEKGVYINKGKKVLVK